MNFDVGEVKARANGRWLALLHELGNDPLKQAVAQFERSPGSIRHGPCPVHGGENGDAFRLFKDVAVTGGGYCNTCGPFHDGFKLLMAVTGASFKTTLAQVAGALRVFPDAPQPTAASRGTDPERQRSDQRCLQDMRDLYRASCPVATASDGPGQLVRDYLAKRGIDALPTPHDLRAHPALFYKGEDGEANGHYPGMLALVRDPADKIVGMHRTFLDGQGGKAPVRKAKKEMPRPSDLQTRGGAIRLGAPTGSILGVAEGIETALACWKATGIPTWSTLNRVLMEQFVPPAGVEQIVIFADKDRSGAGQLSAAKLAQRLLTSGRDVVVIQPRPPIPDDAAGIDWNDVLCTQGPAGFAALHLQGGNPLPDVTPAVTPTV